MNTIYKYFTPSFLNRIYKFSCIFFVINLLLFASFLFQDIFLNFKHAGDESKYLRDLLKANELGLGKAILDGTSIPYLILSFFLNKIINSPLLALKITSLIVGIILYCVLLIFNKIFLRINPQIKTPVFLWLAYLFVIQATIFVGVNDILLAFFGTLFFISLLIPHPEGFKKILLISIFLAFMLLTRKMALTYILVFFCIYFILAFFLSKNSNINFKNGLLLLLAFSAVFIILNSYSLIIQQTFSFDDKILPGKINWAQWDYHNAILINSGVQERFHHVDIKETENYLIENGKNSLPSTFIEMIFFNPALTIKEFFIDLATGIKYIIRQTGLMIFPFFIFLLFRFHKIYRAKSVSASDLIYLFSFLYFLTICFVVVTNIQGRWFMVFLPITMLLIAKDLSKLSRKNQLIFSILNNLILIIMCIPYLIKKLIEFL